MASPATYVVMPYRAAWDWVWLPMHRARTADRSSRPAVADQDAGIENYDVVFLGFPIWWGVAPTVVNTFLECYDFSGKTIVLFATSGGSGLGRSAAGLRGSVAADTKIVEGRMLNGRLSPAGLKEWTDSLKL